MTPLTKIGRRLDNISRYILDNYPQDKWVLSNIVPMFLEAIKSSTSVKEEQLIVTRLNQLINSYEFRYNKIFELLREVLKERPGLWANIRAQRKRGEKPARKGSKAYKTAVKAGKEINKDS